jgi:hypothetical protein
LYTPLHGHDPFVSCCQSGYHVIEASVQKKPGNLLNRLHNFSHIVIDKTNQILYIIAMPSVHASGPAILSILGLLIIILSIAVADSTAGG